MDAPTRMRRIVATLCALLALGIGIDAGWLQAKALLAQWLLREAWAARDLDGAPPPWPWADTRPVARLRVPAHAIDQIVLAGDAGRTLAFAPGWAESSGIPGASGTVILSAHRDTHFAFLRHVARGDTVELEAAGGTRRYAVVGTAVVDARTMRVALGDDDALLLVTCWPFDTLVAGGPLRYVVQARPLDRI
jgi:sortase A